MKPKKSEQPQTKRSKATRAPRVQRPELERTAPVRSWSGIFGADAAAPAVKPAPQPPAATRRPRTAQTVQRGVELGYRVMDEYLKQGAAVASAFGGPRRGQAPSSADLPKMTQRMMQYASDFTALWFDAMNMMMQTQSSQSQPGAAAQQARLVIELRASRPVDVLATFDRPLTGEIVMEPAGKRDKIDIAIEPRTDPASPLKLRVHVPENTRPGRYTRAILDAQSSHPGGRVTVTVNP